MRPIAGIETEYRIAGEYPVEQLCSMAREAVAAIAENKHIKWSYQYPIELWYFDAENRMVANGSRVYNELHYIEYSTAECTTPRELVAVDKAGEILVRQLLNYLRETGYEISVIKNNYGYYDGIMGYSNACHENYSVSPKLFKRLTRRKRNKHQNAWLTFLGTRFILTGSGKIGPIFPMELSPVFSSQKIPYVSKIFKSNFDQPPQNMRWGFEISQRIPLMLTLRSHETMKFRPFINLRDEPHADPNQYRRLHVIVGDANRSEFSTFLKVGMSQMILSMLEKDIIPTDIVLSDQKRGTKQISFDPELKTLVETNKGMMRAIDIQWSIIENVVKFLEMELDSVYKEVFEYWVSFLEILEINKFKLFGYLDWITKYLYYLKYKELSQNWQDLLWIDMAYHRLGDGDLYEELLTKRVIECLLSTEDVLYHQMTPPSTSRAVDRMNLVNDINDQISEINWNYILLKNGKELFLNHPYKEM